MKRRVGIALAGAVLAAGMVGGAGFAAGSGNAATRHATYCANLQQQVVQAQLKIATATNPRQSRAFTKQMVRLQLLWLRQCTVSF